MLKKGSPRRTALLTWKKAYTLLAFLFLVIAIAGPIPFVEAEEIEDEISDPQGDVVAPMGAPEGVSLDSYDLVSAKIVDEPQAKKIILTLAGDARIFLSFADSTQPSPLVVLFNINVDDDPASEVQIGLMTSMLTIGGGDEYSISIFQNLDPQMVSVEGNQVTITISKSQLGPVAELPWSFRGLSSDYPAVSVTDGNYYIQDEIPSPPPSAPTPIQTTTTSPQPSTTTQPVGGAPEVNLGPEALVAEFMDPEGDVRLEAVAGGGYSDLGVEPDSMDIVKLQLYETPDSFVVVIETRGPIDPRFLDPEHMRSLEQPFTLEVVLEYDAENADLARLVFQRGFMMDEATGNLVDAMAEGWVEWGGNRVIVTFPRTLIPPAAGEVSAIYVNRWDTGFYRVNTTALLQASDTLDNAEQVYNKYMQTETQEPTATLPVETSQPPAVCTAYEETLVEKPPVESFIINYPATGEAEAYNVEQLLYEGLKLEASKGPAEIVFKLGPNYDLAGEPDNVKVVIEATVIGQELRLESEPVDASGNARIYVAGLPMMGAMPEIMVEGRLVVENANDCTRTVFPLRIIIETKAPGPVHTSTPSPTQTGVTPPSTGPGMGEPTMPGMEVEAKVHRLDVYVYEQAGKKMVAYWMEAEVEAKGAVDYMIYTVTRYKDGTVDESELGKLSELLSFSQKVGEGHWLLAMPGNARMDIVQETPGSMEKIRITVLAQAPLAEAKRDPADVESVSLKVVALADTQGEKWNSVVVPVEYKLHNQAPPSEFQNLLSGQSLETQAPQTTTRTRLTTSTPPEETGEVGEEAAGEEAGEGGSGMGMAVAAVVLVLVAGGVLAFLRRGR